METLLKRLLWIVGLSIAGYGAYKLLEHLVCIQVNDIFDAVKEQSIKQVDCQGIDECGGEDVRGYGFGFGV